MNIASIIQGVATLSWLGLIGILALMVVRASRQQSSRGLGSAVIALAILALVLTSVGAGLVLSAPNQYADPIVRFCFFGSFSGVARWILTALPWVYG